MRITYIFLHLTCLSEKLKEFRNVSSIFSAFFESSSVQALYQERLADFHEKNPPFNFFSKTH